MMASSIRLLQRPLVMTIRVAVAMRRKEPAAVMPEPGPNALAVRPRYLQACHGLAGEELKASFLVHGRQGSKPAVHLEQEHQPMGLALVAMLAHQPRQMQVGRRKPQPQLFLRLTARADIRRLADIRVQLPAARAPKPSIRLLCPLQQQRLVLLIEAVKQRRNFVRQAWATHHMQHPQMPYPGQVCNFGSACRPTPGLRTAWSPGFSRLAEKSFMTLLIIMGQSGVN